MFFKADFYFHDETISPIRSYSYEGEDINLFDFLKSRLNSFKSPNPSQILSLDIFYMNCHLDTLEGTYEYCLANLPTFTSEAIRYIRDEQDSIKEDNPLMNERSN